MLIRLQILPSNQSLGTSGLKLPAKDKNNTLYTKVISPHNDNAVQSISNFLIRIWFHTTTDILSVDL